MKNINDLNTTISKMELGHRTDHFVIGSNDEIILEGTYETIEKAHAKAMELMTTGEHHHLDIEARDIDGEFLEVYTVYQEIEEEDED